MENSKAKNLIIVVLIILLLVCLGVVVWQYVSINNTTLNSNVADVSQNNSQSGSLNTDIDNVYKELRDEITSLKATITVKDNEIANLKTQNGSGTNTVYKYIVEDAVNEYNAKSARSSCPDQEWLSKSIRLPKINIDTKTVKQINESIMKLNKEASTYKGGSDLVIDYTYKYIPSKNLLYIFIEEGHIAHCATGSVSYVTYFYDVKKDKLLTPKELFNEYKIDMELFKDLADEKLKEYLGEGREAEYNEYKTRLNEIIKDQSYTIFNLNQHQIEVYFQVDLGGFTINIQ